MTKSRDIANSTSTLDVDGGTIKLDGNYPVGTGNVALGDTALSSGSLSGVQNTALGSEVLASNTSGARNTSVGYQSLDANTSGSDNVSVGRRSLTSNTTGINNAGLGTQALALNTTGGSNTAIGVDALLSNTTANMNTAVGYQAGASHTTGSSNTFIGKDCGRDSTTGSGNTFIGVDSGYNVTTGSKNTILGRYNANQGGLDIRTSSNNIVLSDGDGNPRVVVNSSGKVLCGLTGVIAGSRVETLQTSGASGSHAAFATFMNSTGGETQVTFHNPNGKVGQIDTNGSSTSYITSSDYRLKENVDYTWDATTRLKQLKPARFNFIADADTTVDGFLAHEAQAVVPEAVSGTHNAVDDDGVAVMQGIDQSKLVPLLVKTIQELEARITALEA